MKVINFLVNLKISSVVFNISYITESPQALKTNFFLKYTSTPAYSHVPTPQIHTHTHTHIMLPHWDFNFTALECSLGIRIPECFWGISNTYPRLKDTVLIPYYFLWFAIFFFLQIRQKEYKYWRLEGLQAYAHSKNILHDKFLANYWLPFFLILCSYRKTSQQFFTLLPPRLEVYAPYPLIWVDFSDIPIISRI